MSGWRPAEPDELLHEGLRVRVHHGDFDRFETQVDRDEDGDYAIGPLWLTNAYGAEPDDLKDWRFEVEVLL